MAADLLSVEEARARVLAAVVPRPPEEVPVRDALDRVLAEDVTARHDVPAWANSAMDGFAVAAGPAGRALRITGEARAGHPAARPVGPGEAFRISTGAPLPEGVDAVIRVEDTEERDGEVLLQALVEPGANVRWPGEDLRAGAAVLQAGTRLGPAELAVAVTAGRGSVACARRPRVAVVVTGDELAPAGAPLGPGRIHDSNAIALAALAARAGGRGTAHAPVPDDAAATERALGAALEGADVLVVSGGVSVGAHDHVKRAFARLDVRERFWGVSLKPGKPTWFGTRGEQLVFGLPGNPVSAMVCFALFARPALLALQGADPAPRRLPARLGAAVARDRRRLQAVRVRLASTETGAVALPTGPQGSHIVSSMLGADALLPVAPGTGELPAGAPVEVELL